MYGGHILSGKTSELWALDMERLCWREVKQSCVKRCDMPSPRDKTTSWTYDQW